ncbi:MAG: hypothetical protein VXZ07_00395, partial [Pseudomonadota bacterium]|nr:hypothetical protein [Pseudomonadota bacterium]
GVVALSIELTEAVICDCPQAIRLNGITLLNKLIIKKIINNLLLITKLNFNTLHTLSRNIDAINTRKNTIIRGDIVRSAISIQMYEPPHKRDSMINLIQSKRPIMLPNFS